MQRVSFSLKQHKKYTNKCINTKDAQLASKRLVKSKNQQEQSLNAKQFQMKIK